MESFRKSFWFGFGLISVILCLMRKKLVWGGLFLFLEFELIIVFVKENLDKIFYVIK